MKFGTTELLIILAVVLLVLGPTQIPKLTKMFGKSVKGFKEGLGEDEEKDNEEKAEKTAKSDKSEE